MAMIDIATPASVPGFPSALYMISKRKSGPSITQNRASIVNAIAATYRYHDLA
jgi:hypothetical protein